MEEYSKAVAPSNTVVRLVADASGIDPLDLTPLGEVVDPDALDALFDVERPVDGSVRFEYSGYAVTVRSDGDVSIEAVDA